MHQRAYEVLGLDEWHYGRHEVDEASFAQFLSSCGPEWAGLSLTMPLKVTAMQHMDVIEPLAKVVGAINTVLFTPGPLLVGANTDVHGIVAALGDATPLPRKRASRAVIIGGGATASSALIALGQIGAISPDVVVRSRSRAGGVMRAGNNAGLEPRFITFDDPHLPTLIAQADVVISTIPAAATQELNSLIAYLDLKPEQVLLDVIYGDGPSQLIATWRERGGSTTTGLEMLLHQGAEQVRLMTSRTPPIAEMRESLIEAIAHNAAPEDVIPKPQ